MQPAAEAPGRGAYRNWQLQSLFVHCSNTQVHGEDSLHPAIVKYVCAMDPDHPVEVDREPQTIGELERAMASNPTLPMLCHGCNSRTNGRAYLKCRGTGVLGQRCPETTMEGGCCWLQQVVAPPPGQACEVYHMDADALFRFDPCGHYVSLEAIQGAMQHMVEGGMGSASVSVSPESGQYSFTCPLGCRNSFLHDIHHFKTCGNSRWYLHMKNWAFEKFIEQNQGRAGGAPPERMRSADPVSLRKIQEAMTEALVVQCPRCPPEGLSGQLNGGCTHITCDRGHKYCYVCRSTLQGPNNMCPRGCFLLLMVYRELGEETFAAVQRFHVLKIQQKLHALHHLDPDAFREIVETFPNLLTNICPYDGMDANGEHQPENELPGVSLTYEQVAHFEPPAWLPTLDELDNPS